MAFQQWADDKDPTADLEYWVDWGPQLAGATIKADAGNPIIEPEAGSGLLVSTFQNLGTRTYARFSGGLEGDWEVKFTLVDSSGQTHVRRVVLTVALT